MALGRSTRLLVLTLALAAVATDSRAGALETLALEPIAGGFERPTYVAGDPARAGHLLVVEQAGLVWLVVDGEIRVRPFLDIRARVRGGGERGLLSVAFDPAWPDRRHVYVNYTDLAGHTVVERHRVRRDLNRARRRARQVLRVEQPFANHNGGQLQVGPDGYLYVGMGDGGGAGDPFGAGQDLSTLLGKVLRIDVRRLPFVVPDDNPLLPGVGRTAIWALGVRNPWRFSFDRATGDLYLGDVGQGAREEIDYLAAGSPGGANFGWDVREGSLPFDPTTVPATTPLIDPVHEYGRGEGRSITGGYVYRGEAIPWLVGHYLFADFADRRVWSIRVSNGRARDLRDLTGMFAVPGGAPAISSFGEDANGELYLCDYGRGAIYRIVGAD